MKRKFRIISLLLTVLMVASILAGISLPASAASVAVTDGMPFKTNAVNTEKMAIVLSQKGEWTEPYGWSETEAIDATNGLYAIIKLPVGAKISQGRLWGTWSYADNYIICGSTDDAVYNGDAGDPAHSSWVQIGEYIDPNAGNHKGWSGGTNTNVTSTDTVNAYTYLKVQLKAGCNIDPTYTKFAPRCFCVYGEFTGNVPVTGVGAIQSDPGHPIAVGITGTLSASIVPAAATNKTVTWTSDNACVSIDPSTGYYTAVSEGTATITATSADGGKTNTLTLNVENLPVTGIEDISGIELEVEVGNTGTVSTKTIPYYAANPNITWSSSDQEVLTVDPGTGAWSAVGAGNVRITATSQGNSEIIETIDVTVIPYYENLALQKPVKVQSYGDPNGVSFLVDGNRYGGAFSAKGGDQFPFEIVIDLGAQTEFNKVFHQSQITGWDSYMRHIKIYGSNDDAVFTTAEGADKLLLTEEQQNHPSWVELADFENDAARYNASVIFKETANYRYVKFAILSAAEGYVRMEEISVYKVDINYVTDVTISNPFTEPVKIGDTGTLNAAVTPSNATWNTVTWSSNDPTIIEIDEDTGEWKAVGEGKATITATAVDGTDITDSFEATSVSVPAASIAFDYEPSVLDYGGSDQLIATIEPYNTTNKAITWTSSNPENVSVDQEGNIEGLMPCTSATITATTANGISVSTIVNVTGVLATDIQILNATTKAVVGETGMLSAEVVPDDVSIYDIVWSSSDNTIITIDPESGVWTAVAEGTATISATTKDGSNLTDTTDITVVVPVTDIGVPDAPTTVDVGANGTFTAAVTPDNATNGKVTWISSDVDVLEIDAQTGAWTAKTEGVVTITVISTDGTEIEFSFDIEVVTPYQLGDVNEDDSISILDALAIFKHISGKEPIAVGSSAASAADVDGNGNISIMDALAIFKHIAGKVIITSKV